MEAGQKVKMNFAGLKFEGEITRVGADKGKDTKVQVKNLKDGGKPLWYPASAMTVIAETEAPVLEFMFAGALKKGVEVSRKGGRVTMKTEKDGEYTVKEEDVYFTPRADKEVASVLPKRDAPTPKEEAPIVDENENTEATEPEEIKPRATALGEAIIKALQGGTKQSEEVQCLTVTEISDKVGKTQPQVKASLNILNDMGLVLIGVCSNDPNTAALTPEGFGYECGKPADYTNPQNGEKKVSKKDRIIAAYYQGLTNKEITEQVGCDASYPGWLIKEEIAKGNITPRA